MLALILSLWFFGAFCMLLDTARLAHQLSNELQPVWHTYDLIAMDILEEDEAKSFLAEMQKDVKSPQAWAFRVLPSFRVHIILWPLSLFSLLFGQQLYENRIKEVIAASIFFETNLLLKDLSEEKAHEMIATLDFLFKELVAIRVVEVFERHIALDDEDSNDRP